MSDVDEILATNQRLVDEIIERAKGREDDLRAQIAEAQAEAAVYREALQGLNRATNNVRSGWPLDWTLFDEPVANAMDALANPSPAIQKMLEAKHLLKREIEAHHGDIGACTYNEAVARLAEVRELPARWRENRESGDYYAAAAELDRALKQGMYDRILEGGEE